MWGAGWGELILDAAGINSITDDVILTSNNGAGGLLYLRKASGSQGVSLWGGNVGAGAALALTNDVGTTTVFMDGDESGDDAVQIPAGAISAIETLNEPGIASANEQATTALAQFATTIVESQTITAPSSGYVVAIGTLQLSIGHTNGTADSGSFAVSPDGSFPLTRMVHQIASSAPTGQYYDIITVQAVYSVLSGVNTFNLLAQESLGNYTVRNRQLSLVFIPTAYGTYEAPSSPGGSDDLSSASGPDDFEAARLREELAIVKAKAEETTRRLDALESMVSREQVPSAATVPE